MFAMSKNKTNWIDVERYIIKGKKNDVNLVRLEGTEMLSDL